MKKLFMFLSIAFFSLTNAKENLFFLSSENIVQEPKTSLEPFHSFNFFPLLKLEKKNADKIMNIVDIELQKVGNLVKKPILTSKGADFDSFSNPTLRFTLEQLVDQNNKPLPLLQATLQIKSATDCGELSNIQDVSKWVTYLKPSNNIQNVVQKSLANLLAQFSEDFQRSHDDKPTIYVSYDASWWKS